MMSYNRRKCVKFIGEETYQLTDNMDKTKRRSIKCLYFACSVTKTFVCINMLTPYVWTKHHFRAMQAVAFDFAYYHLFSIFLLTCDLHELLQANTCMSAMIICHWLSVALPTEFGRNPYFQVLSLYLNLEDYHKTLPCNPR